MLNCNLKLLIMGLLVTLNEEGFQTLKKDRDIVKNKIKELELVLSHLDPAYIELQPYYEPIIDITIVETKGKDMYVGELFIVTPVTGIKRKITFGIDYIEKYKDINDEKLLEDAKREAREHLTKRFPSFFE
jgi:hypothetical protein